MMRSQAFAIVAALVLASFGAAAQIKSANSR